MSHEKTPPGEAFAQKLIRLRTRIDLLPPEQRSHLYELADAISREHRHLLTPMQTMIVGLHSATVPTIIGNADLNRRSRRAMNSYCRLGGMIPQSQEAVPVADHGDASRVRPGPPIGGWSRLLGGGRQRNRIFGQRVQIIDDVGAFLRIGLAREGHFRAAHIGLRIGEEFRLALRQSVERDLPGLTADTGHGFPSSLSFNAEVGGMQVAAWVWGLAGCSIRSASFLPIGSSFGARAASTFNDAVVWLVGQPWQRANCRTVTLQTHCTVEFPVWRLWAPGRAILNC